MARVTYIEEEQTDNPVIREAFARMRVKRGKVTVVLEFVLRFLHQRVPANKHFLMPDHNPASASGVSDRTGGRNSRTTASRGGRESACASINQIATTDGPHGAFGTNGPYGYARAGCTRASCRRTSRSAACGGVVASGSAPRARRRLCARCRRAGTATAAPGAYRRRSPACGWRLRCRCGGRPLGGR